MRQYQRVYYHGAEWTYIETIGDKYLLRSINKNIGDTFAPIADVRPFVVEKKS